MRVGRRAAGRARARGRRGRAAHGRRRTRWSVFISVFGPAIALGIDATARCCAGREPEADDIEPLSRAHLRAGARRRPRRLPRRRRAAAGARARPRRVLRRVRPPADARAGRAAAADRRLQRARRGPDGATWRAPACSRRTRRCSTSPGQPAISIPVGFGDDGLPTSVQIVGKPLSEDRCCRSRCRSKPRSPWAHQRPPETVLGRSSSRAEHVGHPPGPHAERLGAGRSRPRGEHRHREHLRLVPGGERGRARERLARPRSAAPQAGAAGTRHASRRRRPARAPGRAARTRAASARPGPASS